MTDQVIAVLGIHTGVGKTVAAGLLAGYLAGQGERVITQKPVQTGCAGRAADLVVHRRLMGVTWTPEDEEGLTCSYCLDFPGSPHLAARLAGTEIDSARISQATDRLLDTHDRVILEGAGGLLVPLTDSLLLLDYIHERGYPVLLVTAPYLGAVNHTLLSLEALRHRNMKLLGLVINLYGDHRREIVADSLRLFRDAVAGRAVVMADMAESRQVDWARLFAEEKP